MKTIMVRYKTSEAQAEANAALVHAVFDELRATTSTGIRYTCYREPDGATFVHLATLETPEQNPLATLPAFKAFLDKLKERCVEMPVLTELSALETYGGAL